MRSITITLLLGMSLALWGCGDKDTNVDDDENDSRLDTGGSTGIGNGGLDADGDGYPEASDCDDYNNAAYPDAPEVCDDVDNDCDGLIDGDDDDLQDGTTYYQDSDADGYGKRGVEILDCALPDGYSDNDLDCLDSNGFINPGADEVCDGEDNDCDSETDEDDAIDAIVWYVDSDRDGYGTDETYYACELPEDHSAQSGDCDDTEPSVNPDGVEYCDDLDNDCNGLIDSDDPGVTNLRTWYYDGDNDGHGIDSNVRYACTAPSGYVSDDDDCDDSDDTVSPSEPEICDEQDNDCDDLADEDDSDLTDALTWYADTDGDDFGDVDATTAACSQPEGYVADSADCDDGNDAVNPDADEICDGVDADCDGFTYCLPSLGDDATLIAVGANASDRAGYAVASAGDVDGDGSADILIGAYSNDDSASDAGVAYVVFGGASGTMDLDSADRLLTGEDADDRAGFALAGAGDFDEDGYDDILVGAYQNDDGGSNAGKAYLVFGPATSSGLASADGIWTGEDADDRAGYAVSSAGDFNGDGNADVLIGAYQNDDGASDAGAVYLILGSGSGAEDDLSDADGIWTGEAADDQAGKAIAGIGDTDADGYDDFAIGALEDDDTDTDAGAVYIIEGSTSVSDGSLSGADAKLAGENADDNAGAAVSGAGDYNNDGYDDVIIGASGYDLDSKSTSAGAAYIVFGPLSDGSLSDADVILTGEVAGDRAGAAVSGGNDVDGDGHDDVLIGAYSDDTTDSAAGAAYLLYGPTSGSYSLSIAVTKFVGDVSFDYAGWSVASVGDFDDDGSDDVLVGAYQNDDGGTNAGAAYLMTSWE